MASDENVKINRSYSDNFDVKDFTINKLVPKYFTGEGISQRNVGLLGLTAEQISNISEDAFNTGSVFMREVYPNRAELAESIYSHAAIFEISNLFATPATCNFVLILSEEAILNNLTYGDRGIGYFYIDKNTIINVEGIDFSLDYDIMIKVIDKPMEGKNKTYQKVFSASYMISGEMNNTVNPNQNPYIPIKRSVDGFLALDIITHQYIREVHYETILNNSRVNSPVIDIPFTGQLAGFDIMYKTTDETDYTTQLKPQVLYSQPSTTPFCYYTKANESTLRISFNTKDLYFMPEFGSSLKIILYLTNGTMGEFPTYTGNNVSITQNAEKYKYADQYLMAAKPLTSSHSASDSLAMEGLRRLAVQGYRTANALTTDADLAEYFSNYSYMYGKENLVKFIKKRNDIFERLYGAVIVIRNNGQIFKTNTLNLKLNVGDMLHPEDGVYVIEPGVLFRYQDGATKNTDGAVVFYDKTTRDQYRDRYNALIKELKATRTSPFFSEEYSILANPSLEKYDYYFEYEIIESEDENLIGCFYVRNADVQSDTGVNYNLYRRHEDGSVELVSDTPVSSDIINNAIAAGFVEDKLSPILQTLYIQKDRKSVSSALQAMTVSLSEWVTRIGEVNLTYLFDMPEEELAKYDDIRSELVNVGERDNWYTNLTDQFLFLNPFLIRFYKNPNMVNLYLTYVSQDVVFDFSDQNDDSFMQFIAMKMRVERSFEERRRYKFTTAIESNVKTSLKTAPLLEVLDAYINVQDGTILKQSTYGRIEYDLYSADNVLIKEHYITKPAFQDQIITETTNNGIWTELEDEFTYRVGETADPTNAYLRVIGCMKDDYNNPICWFEFKPSAYDPTTGTITFEAEVYTDDHITSDGKIRLLSESKFYDRRDRYTYYTSKYPERLDGSPIYENIQSTDDASSLVCINDLPSDSIIIDTIKYPSYKTDSINSILTGLNDVSDEKYHIAELDGVDVPCIQNATNATWNDTSIRNLAELTGTSVVYLFINNESGNHSLYYLVKVDTNDGLKYSALYIGTGYRFVEEETCYPVYYETSEGIYTKYCVVNGRIIDIIADTYHANGAYSIDELEELAAKGYLNEITVDNPEYGNYYMRSQTKPTVFNYYKRGEDLVYRIERVDGKAVEYSSALIPSFKMFYEEASTHIMTGDEHILVPYSDLNCEVYTLTKYRPGVDTVTVDGVTTSRWALFDDGEGDNLFMDYDSTLSSFIWTNKYTTITDGVTLVKPLNNCKVHVDFEDYTKDGIDVMDIKMLSVPFIKWDIAADPEKFTYFIRNFAEEYDVLTAIINTHLRNQSELDIKLYNTYGLGTNFIVGESGNNPQSLDTLNLCIEFDVWFKNGTDISTSISYLKFFIKNTIEEINASGLNNLYISNLLRKIENEFDFVDHVRFVRINNYDSSMQTIRNKAVDLEEIESKTERRMYVPEILTVDIDNIIINDYIS